MRRKTSWASRVPACAAWGLEQRVELKEVERRRIEPVDILPRKEDRFRPGLPPLPDCVGRGKVVGFLVDMHHVGLPFAEVTPQLRVVVPMVVPIEANVFGYQIIACRKAGFQRLPMVAFTPKRRHDGPELDIRKLRNLLQLALVRAYDKGL